VTKRPIGRNDYHECKLDKNLLKAVVTCFNLGPLSWNFRGKTEECPQANLNMLVRNNRGLNRGAQDIINVPVGFKHQLFSIMSNLLSISYLKDLEHQNRSLRNPTEVLISYIKARIKLEIIAAFFSLISSFFKMKVGS
jgi:hypothetical protein